MKRNVIGVFAVLALVASFFVSSVFNHQAQGQYATADAGNNECGCD